MTFDTFDAICAEHPYQPKGMFYSEIYFFLLACQRHGCQAIIESGVKFGMSTMLLNAAFEGDVVSVEKTPVVAIPNATILIGDSLQLVPELVRQYIDRNVCVLIDGPKGIEAHRLRQTCQHLGARVVAVHDQQPGHGESRHSHSKSFRELARTLDRFVSPEYREKYPNGSGLAIWEK